MNVIATEAQHEEHEELLRLSLSTGSTYQLPQLSEPQPQPPPESPPHLSLLQLMPPSSSSSPLLHESPQPPSGFPFPLFHQATRIPETPSHYFSQPPQKPCYSFSPQPQTPKQNSHAPPADFRQTPEATPSPPPEGQAGSSAASRVRKKCKETPIEPPYQWATSTRAKILSMDELLSQKITVISGNVRCRRCNKVYEVKYDLQNKFSEISSFIVKKKDLMHDRAPKEWRNPQLLDSKLCGHSKCVEPIINY